MKIKPGCTAQEHNPELIPLWSSKNTLKPDEISYGSNKTIYLICKKHGDYPTTGKAASRGRRCPTCSHKGLPPFNESLAYLRPDIASTWSSKNDCTPFEVWPSEGNSKHSGKRIWICPIHGDYEATCADRTNNQGCRLCGIESARKKKSIPLLDHSLGDLYPSLLPEWSNKNSKGPFDVKPGSSYVAKWICSKCGHKWESLVYNRTSKHMQGCKFCGYDRMKEHHSTPPYNKSLAYLYPSIASELSPDNPKTADKIYAGSEHKYIWVCPNGHKYPARVSHRTYMHSNCPHCCNLGRSQAENFLRSSLTALGSLPTPHKIGHWEVDIFFPERNTIIEYDGAYYHSFPKSLQTDTRKSLDLLSQGYTLIRVRTYSKNYQLPSLQISHSSYHEIFTSEPLDSQPTPDLLDKITSLL